MHAQKARWGSLLCCVANLHTSADLNATPPREYRSPFLGAPRAPEKLNCIAAPGEGRYCRSPFVWLSPSYTSVWPPTDGGGGRLKLTFLSAYAKTKASTSRRSRNCTRPFVRSNASRSSQRAIQKSDSQTNALSFFVTRAGEDIPVALAYGRKVKQSFLTLGYVASTSRCGGPSSSPLRNTAHSGSAFPSASCSPSGGPNTKDCSGT